MKKRWLVLSPDGQPLWDTTNEKPEQFKSLNAAKVAACDAAVSAAGGYFSIFELTVVATMPITRVEIFSVKK